jgi:hypothetical protein
VLDNADAPTTTATKGGGRRAVKLPPRVLDIIRGMRKAK